MIIIINTNSFYYTIIANKGINNRNRSHLSTVPSTTSSILHPLPYNYNYRLTKTTRIGFVRNNIGYELNNVYNNDNNDNNIHPNISPTTSTTLRFSMGRMGGDYYDD